MKALANAIIAILFLIIVALAPGIVRDARSDQQAKADLAEINHIMYGIFSVNAWKGQISDIMFAEIRKLDFKTTSVKLKKTIENQLSAVIDKLNEQVRQANRSSLGGRVKQALIDLVVDIEDVKKGVPGYADTLIAEMNKKENEKVVKDLAAQQMRRYFKRTFVEQDMSKVEAVLQRTASSTVEEANEKLHAQIEQRRPWLATRGAAVIGLALVLFLRIGISRRRSRFDITILFGTLLVLLSLGVSIPMIDLEAKIAEMSFVLIGHKIGFENQILYFQSKSIFDVFWLMITHPQARMKFVGVLLVLFSIVIPVTKLASSLALCYFEKTRSNTVLRFLAFKTGKWSMADVMVVAILMAYIGFNGLVETQFGKMKALVPEDVVFITTNGTSMQLGYYLFTAYAVLALFFAGFLPVGEKAKE